MKQKISFLIKVFVVALIILLFHIFATHFYLYWSFSWLDNVMHFVSGGLAAFTLGSFLFTFLKFGQKISPNEGKKSTVWFFIATILCALTVGLVWELTEQHFGLSLNNLADTISDIVMDTLGAILVFVLFKNKMHYGA